MIKELFASIGVIGSVFGALIYFSATEIGKDWDYKILNTCTPEEIAHIDALVIERNGTEIGDVSESERRGFSRDYYNCSHPNIDWREL